MGIKKENRGILSKSLSNGKGVDRRIMTELDANKKAEELLKGAYDLHVHSSPSVDPGGRRGRNGGSDAEKSL